MTAIAFEEEVVGRRWPRALDQIKAALHKRAPGNPSMRPYYEVIYSVDVNTEFAHKRRELKSLDECRKLYNEHVYWSLVATWAHLRVTVHPGEGGISKYAQAPEEVIDREWRLIRKGQGHWSTRKDSVLETA